MLYSLFTDKTPTYPKPYCLSDLNQMLTKSFQTMEVYTYIYKKIPNMFSYLEMPSIYDMLLKCSKI